MEYKLESSKWGPYISVDDKMVFYDFILDHMMHAKDLPPVVIDPVMTYHMWFSPLNPEVEHSGSILAARGIDGLERVLEAEKKSAMEKCPNKTDYEKLIVNLPKIWVVNPRPYFLLK